MRGIQNSCTGSRGAAAKSPSPAGPYSHLSRRALMSTGAAALLGACSRRQPKIEFTRLPAADKGGPELIDTIAGRVTGFSPAHRIVLFARSEGWWLQPGKNLPYTRIKPDGTWSNSTHLGMEYAALLVDESYRPPDKVNSVPAGSGIFAAVTSPGDPTKVARRTTLRFAGYEWTVRASPSDRGGKNSYDPANAWVDGSGALHLKIAPDPAVPGRFTCAQVLLKSSLGYGTYRFVVRDVAHWDPAVVLAMYTWDGAKAFEQNPREWDIEFSRWGDRANKNARYVIQPYNLPNHVTQFEAPEGPLVHSIAWESDRASFRTAHPAGHRGVVYQRAFTSGVPRPANEKLRLNFYDFQRGPRQLQEGAEAVIDEFEFLP